MKTELEFWMKKYWDNACKEFKVKLPYPKVAICDSSQYIFDKNEYRHEWRRVPSDTLGEFHPNLGIITISMEYLSQLPKQYVFHALLPHELAHAFDVWYWEKKKRPERSYEEPHGTRWKKIMTKGFGVTKPSPDAISAEEYSGVFFTGNKDIVEELENNHSIEFFEGMDTWNQKHTFHKIMDDYGTEWWIASCDDWIDFCNRANKEESFTVYDYQS
jgi:hypothetical protein